MLLFGSKVTRIKNGGHAHLLLVAEDRNTSGLFKIISEVEKYFGIEAAITYGAYIYVLKYSTCMGYLSIGAILHYNQLLMTAE